MDIYEKNAESIALRDRLWAKVADLGLVDPHEEPSLEVAVKAVESIAKCYVATGDSV